MIKVPETPSLQSVLDFEERRNRTKNVKRWTGDEVREKPQNRRRPQRVPTTKGQGRREGEGVGGDRDAVGGPGTGPTSRVSSAEERPNGVSGSHQ